MRYNQTALITLFENAENPNVLDKIKDITTSTWKKSRKALATGALATTLAAGLGGGALSSGDPGGNMQFNKTNKDEIPEFVPDPFAPPASKEIPKRVPPIEPQTDFKSFYASQPQKPVEVPKPESIKVVPETPLIDPYIIASLESGNNSRASNQGAMGKYQLRGAAWEEAAKSLYGDNWESLYSQEDNWKRKKLNDKIAKQTFETVIPKQLKAYKVPVTVETVVGAYRIGSAAIRTYYRRNGNNWLKHTKPFIRDYIERYKNLAGEIK